VIAKTVEAPKAPPTGGSATATATAAKAAPTGPTPASLVSAKQSALKACVNGQTDAFMLTVMVEGGKPTVRLTGKGEVSAALDACVKKVIASISFAADGKVTTMIKP